ncbi:MAG TPA: tRNA pseudouridine(55) synthase TruB [Dehalococcoidia bacterium]|nr:tRNA pseudouridine(55) synthase TruB [Dehalococcoidia bacterium]
MTIDGILNVDKPAGWTSFDVVRFVRARSRERHVGHAGTLDPAATGVLPVLLGNATRLTEYLIDGRKGYRARIELGVETDTYDKDGTVVASRDASRVALDDVLEALRRFEGQTEQRPPAFSAIKRAGEPLYKAARRGEAQIPEPRLVTAYEIDIISYEPPLVEVYVECGKGFYVRSLAHDLGQALGVGGTLAGLVRTRVGPFRIEEAVGVETLRQAFEAGDWTEWLFAADEALIGWRAAVLGPENEANMRHGRTARIRWQRGVRAIPGELCRAYSVAGDFLGVLRWAGADAWRPEKVFAT